MTGKNQRKRVALKIREQLENGEKLNVTKAMREVGYAPSTVNSKTTDVVRSSEVQNEIKEFTDKMDELIENSYEEVKKKKGDGSFRDNVVALDTFTKLKRLVEGKSTDNKAHLIGNILDSLEEEA